MLVPLCLVRYMIYTMKVIHIYSNCNLLVQIGLLLGLTNTVYQECSLPVFWDQYLLKELGRLVSDFYSRCLQQQQEQRQTPIQPDPVADLLRYLPTHCGQDPGLLDELESLSNGPAGLLHISGVFGRLQCFDGGAQRGERAVQHSLDVGADPRRHSPGTRARPPVV